MEIWVVIDYAPVIFTSRFNQNVLSKREHFRFLSGDPSSTCFIVASRWGRVLLIYALAVHGTNLKALTVWVPRYPSIASSQGSQQTFRLKLAAFNSVSIYMTLEWGTRAKSNITDCDALLSQNLLSESLPCVFRLRVYYVRVFSLVVFSSNLSGFVYKFSAVDQFLCPIFKKQRRRFLLVKLCTGNVNIFLYCEFICKFSFANMYFPTHV